MSQAPPDETPKKPNEKDGFTKMPLVYIPADPRLEEIKTTIAALKVELVKVNGEEQHAILRQIGGLQRTAEHVRRELLGVGGMRNV